MYQVNIASVVCFAQDWFESTLTIIISSVVYLLCAANTQCTSYVNLNKMPWLFKGKGDIQFNVYRDVRNHTRSVTIATVAIYSSYIALAIMGNLKGK